jgi:hypothetical protein
MMRRMALAVGLACLAAGAQAGGLAAPGAVAPLSLTIGALPEGVTLLRLWGDGTGLRGQRTIVAGRQTIEWRQGYAARLREDQGRPLAPAVVGQLRALVPGCPRGTVADLVERQEPGGTIELRWDCVWLQ